MMTPELKAQILEYYTSLNTGSDLDKRIVEYRNSKPQILASLQEKMERVIIKYNGKMAAKQDRLRSKLATIQANLISARSLLVTEVEDNKRLAESEYNTYMASYRSSGKDKYLEKANEKKQKYTAKAAEKKQKYTSKIAELENSQREYESEITYEIRQLNSELENEKASIHSKILNLDSYIDQEVEKMKAMHNAKLAFISQNADKLILVKCAQNGFNAAFVIPRLAGIRIEHSNVTALFLGKEIPLTQKSQIEQDKLLLDPNCSSVDYAVYQKLLHCNNLIGAGSSVMINNISIGTDLNGVTQIGTGSIIGGRVQYPIAMIESNWTYFI